MYLGKITRGAFVRPGFFLRVKMCAFTKYNKVSTWAINRVQQYWRPPVSLRPIYEPLPTTTTIPTVHLYIVHYIYKTLNIHIKHTMQYTHHHYSVA